MSLRFEAIEKSFGATTALRGVTFEVPAGSAHAIVGENGAGKSTLLKILAGLVPPDAGRMLWNGRALAPKNPRDAIEHGIGMVYQEMLCFPNLSVAANVFAGREICRYGLLDERAMCERTAAVLTRLSLAIDPATLAEQLSPAHRQLLQVARALAFECEILVLDEPTTSLTDAEADHLFDVLHSLRAQGTTILYVSHRLPEVFRLCDRITVLRDGALVSTCDRHAVEPADIVKAMVGRDLAARARTPRAQNPGAAAPGERLLVRGLSRSPHFSDVSFAIRRGEVVAVFGLVGSGRSELLETLFGVHQPSSGSLTLDGQPVSFRTPRDAACAGVALVPEERQRQGLLFNLALRHNLVLPRCAVRRTIRIDDGKETEAAAGMLNAWRIKASGVDTLPDTLSGGNQQKVVIAKWLATSPRVLLLDEPTKGVDVGAKFDIHELIRNHAAAGAAVLVVSSDLPEVLALADRVLVMKEGRMQGELPASDATEEAVMHLATHQVVA